MKATPTVLSMKDANALKQTERVALFIEKDKGASRLFIECAKLLIAIEEGIKPGGDSARQILLKRGVREGSVNTASNSARVFKDLVVPKLITEAAFDEMSWADIQSINRVTSGKSKKKLTFSEVASRIRAGGDWGKDLESIFISGLSAAEAAAEAAKAESAKAAKAKADAAALAAAEEENRKLREQLAATAGNSAPPAPEPPADQPEPPADQPEPPADQPEPPAEPAAVQPAPAANPAAATLEDLCALLDEVEAGIPQLSPDDQAVIGARLTALAAMFAPKSARRARGMARA